MLHPVSVCPHELRVRGILPLSEFPPPSSPSVTKCLQVEFMDPVVRMSPVPFALPHLKVVEAHMHLDHPLSEGDPQQFSCLEGLFYGALRNPCAVLETTVNLVPPSQPPR